jgi:hypothetical protein
MGINKLFSMNEVLIGLSRMGQRDGDVVESQCSVWLGIERLAPFVEGYHTAEDIYQDEPDPAGKDLMAREVVWLLKPGDRDGEVNGRAILKPVPIQDQFTDEELPELVVRVFTSKTRKPKTRRYTDESHDGRPHTSPVSECRFMKEFVWTLSAEFMWRMLETPFVPDSESVQLYDAEKVRHFYFHYVMYRYGSGIRCAVLSLVSLNWCPSLLSLALPRDSVEIIR